jgi:ComF family protein
MVRLGIQRLKYELMRDVKPEFLRLLSLALREKLKKRQGWGFKDFLRKRPVVTAVPLHWRRENWRGFNQAEIVAEMVEESLGLERKRLVERRKASRPQVELGKEARAENVKAVFRVRPGVDLPRKVLVVDDVWTTGATMRAVGECLKRAGVKEVWGLSLAR